MSTPDNIRELLNKRAEETSKDMIAWRHHLHRHPELSNREIKTSAFIANRLREMGLDEVKTGIAGHGVLGVLRGGLAGSGVALLRADIDALPVVDESGVDFASTVVDQDYPGGPFPVSHACGHDCHTAMLLGAMRILAEQRGSLPGTVLAVFQPAEEGAPYPEAGGAKAFIDTGVLDEFSPTAAFGMHVQPYPKGMVSLMSGVQFGASSMIRIVITGEQVHGSTPWMGTDPMPAVGAILTSIGQVYRSTDAFSPKTASIGHIEDVGRFNVIGRSVTLWGTIRTLSDQVMEEVQGKVRDLVHGIAQAFGCAAEVEYAQPVPAVSNTEEWVTKLRPSLAEVVGEDNIFVPDPTLGYDDVSEFIARFGGLYIGLGVQDTEFVGGQVQAVEGGRGIVPNHHPAFYADDETLTTGVKLHAHVAYNHLLAHTQNDTASSE